MSVSPCGAETYDECQCLAFLPDPLAAPILRDFLAPNLSVFPDELDRASVPYCHWVRAAFGASPGLRREAKGTTSRSGGYARHSEGTAGLIFRLSFPAGLPRGLHANCRQQGVALHARCM